MYAPHYLSKIHIFLSSEAHLAQKVGDKGLWTWVRTEKDSTKSSGVSSNCSVPLSAVPQGGKSPLEFQLRPKYAGNSSSALCSEMPRLLQVHTSCYSHPTLFLSAGLLTAPRHLPCLPEFSQLHLHRPPHDGEKALYEDGRARGAPWPGLLSRRPRRAGRLLRSSSSKAYVTPFPA